MLAFCTPRSLKAILKGGYSNLSHSILLVSMLKEESLLIQDVLYVPHAFDLRERLVTGKLSRSLETQPDP